MQAGILLLRSVAASALLASVAGAALTHRYSFNDGTANDSVGGANGTLVNGATVSNGQLQFSPSVNSGYTSPTTGQYVSLPGNIVHTSSFTIEAWATTNSTRSWQRILDLGNSDGTNGNGFVILTPYNNAHNPLGQVSIASSGQSYDTNYVTGTAPGGVILPGTEYQYAYVHDLSAGTESLYINGTLIGTAAATVDPSTTQYSDFWIGRSDFSADPYWDGTMDELRTYDTPLTAAQVRADFTAGPNGVPEPTAAAAGVVAAVVALARRRRRAAVVG